MRRSEPDEPSQVAAKIDDQARALADPASARSNSRANRCPFTPGKNAIFTYPIPGLISRAMTLAGCAMGGFAFALPGSAFGQHDLNLPGGTVRAFDCELGISAQPEGRQFRRVDLFGHGGWMPSKRAAVTPALIGEKIDLVLTMMPKWGEQLAPQESQPRRFEIHLDARERPPSASFNVAVVDDADAKGPSHTRQTQTLPHAERAQHQSERRPRRSTHCIKLLAKGLIS